MFDMEKLLSKWKTDKTRHLLEVLCFVTVGTVIYSILTYGQTLIHSDTATATLLARSILSNKDLFPKSWNYANGDIWTIGTHLTTMIPSILLQNQSLARMIGSLIWVLIAMLSVVIMGRVAFKSDFWLIAVPFLFVFTIKLGDMVLYQAAYTGSIKSMALSTALLSIILWEGKQKKYYKPCLVLYFLSSMISAIGGARGLAESTIPMFCAFVICEYTNEKWNSVDVDWKSLRRRVIRGCCFICIPVGIGLLFNRSLSATHILNYSGNSDMQICRSISGCWNNFAIAVSNYLNCFGYFEGAKPFSFHGVQNLISLITRAFICFVIPVFQAMKIKKEAMAVRFFFIFCIIHNCIILVLAVFFGKTTDRYFLSSVFCCILVSSRYIYEYWMKAVNQKKVILLSSFAAAAIIECVGMLQLSGGWRDAVRANKDFCSQLESLGASKGYATYWNAYTNEIYSDCKLRFGAVDVGEGTLVPYRWLVDNSAFQPQDGGSFLMLTEAENETFQKGSFSFVKEPEKVIEKEGMHIYVFDYDICNSFPSALSDGKVLPNELFVTEGGGIINSEEVQLQPGGQMYGPYSDMNPGNYVIIYHGTGLSHVVPKITANLGNVKISGKELLHTDDQITIQLNLASDKYSVEFTAFNSGEAIATIREIVVEKQ